MIAHLQVSSVIFFFYVKHSMYILSVTSVNKHKQSGLESRESLTLLFPSTQNFRLFGLEEKDRIKLFSKVTRGSVHHWSRKKSHELFICCLHTF